MNRMNRHQQKSKVIYRSRMILIASGLIFAIAVLGVTQWAIGTRGWDLLAGLLTIVMVILGFMFFGVLFRILRWQPLPDKEWDKTFPWEREGTLPWDEDSWYDPTCPGSPGYRGPFDR